MSFQPILATKSFSCKSAEEIRWDCKNTNQMQQTRNVFATTQSGFQKANPTSSVFPASTVGPYASATQFTFSQTPPQTSSSSFFGIQHSQNIPSPSVETRNQPLPVSPTFGTEQFEQSTSTTLLHPFVFSSTQQMQQAPATQGSSAFPTKQHALITTTTSNPFHSSTRMQPLQCAPFTIKALDTFALPGMQQSQSATAARTTSNPFAFPSTQQAQQDPVTNTAPNPFIFSVSQQAQQAHATGTTPNPFTFPGSQQAQQADVTGTTPNLFTFPGSQQAQQSFVTLPPNPFACPETPEQLQQVPITTSMPNQCRFPGSHQPIPSESARLPQSLESSTISCAPATEETLPLPTAGDLWRATELHWASVRPSAPPGGEDRELLSLSRASTRVQPRSYNSVSAYSTSARRRNGGPGLFSAVETSLSYPKVTKDFLHGLDDGASRESIWRCSSHSTPVLTLSTLNFRRPSSRRLHIAAALPRDADCMDRLTSEKLNQAGPHPVSCEGDIGDVSGERYAEVDCGAGVPIVECKSGGDYFHGHCAKATSPPQSWSMTTPMESSTESRIPSTLASSATPVQKSTSSHAENSLNRICTTADAISAQSYDPSEEMKNSSVDIQLTHNASSLHAIPFAPFCVDGPRSPAAPTLCAPGYETVPSITSLQQLPTDQLARVEEFAIVRQGVGKVEFEAPCDLRGLDIDSLVRIERGYIDVLSSSLDQAVVVTLWGVHPKRTAGTGTMRASQDQTGVAGGGCSSSWCDEQIAVFEVKLRKCCDKSGAVFIDYEPIQGTWRFRLEEFRV